jgi:hypothetical protein
MNLHDTVFEFVCLMLEFSASIKRIGQAWFPGQK